MSSIPLPALGVKPPQMPDTLEQAGQLMNLKRLMAQQALIPGQQQLQQQQIQSGQQELQMNAQKLQDQQAMTSAMHEWDGKDLNALPSLILKHNGSAQAVFSTKNQILDYQKNLQEMDKNRLANEKTKNDYFAQAIDNVKGLPPEQQAQGFEQAKQDAVQKGYLDPQSAQGMQYQNPQQLDLLEKTLMGHGSVIEQTLKQAEMQKDQAQGREATAKATQVEQENAMGGTQQFADSKYRFLAAQKSAGKAIGADDQAFMKGYEKQKTLVPVANFNLQNAIPGSGNGKPSPLAEAVANGQMKWNDVISPRTPMSVKQAFANEVKQINPNFNSGDFSIEQNVKKAFTTGKEAQELVAFNTAIAHADLLKQAADAMQNGDVRALNSLGNKLGVQFGSDKATNFNVIKNAYSREVTKALSAGHLTDAEIAQQGGTIPDNASPAQISGAVSAYKNLMQSKVQQRKQQFDSGMQAKPNFGGGANQSQQGGVIYARDPQGKLHAAPMGTQLPQGWKLEQK